MNNYLTIRPIGELLKYSFLIPSYQRGYRWDANTQVQDLIKDIADYKIDPIHEDAFYCLQPIVVKKIKEDEYDLIDGQQRLTTILLILHYFNETEFKTPKPLFSINFETRVNQKDFLSVIENKEIVHDNIDLFHLNKSYLFIKRWFEEAQKKNASICGDFYSKLANKVKVIWYEISLDSDNNKEAIDIFTRLNIGKIPLTNAELCKALFMNSINGDSEASKLKQIQIATEWDKIEQTLQQPQFWNFISSKANKYDTRIEYIFDLKQGKTSDDENYYTFYKFSEELKQKDVDTVWLDVKNYFLQFEDWYADHELYNLIGYLVNTGEKIDSLIAEAKSKTKANFKIDLAVKAKMQFSDIKIDDLDFNDNKDTIRRILLLFNILSINHNKKNTSRFPFHHYKSQNWDIEHVHSQTSKEITGKDKIEWAKVLFEYFTGVSVENQNIEELQQQIEKMEETENAEKAFCNELLKISSNENIDDFNQLNKSLNEYFKEDITFEDKNGIGNLVLLDESTNRMYQNAFFPVKRKYIIRQERKGVFIPACTKNVFLKAYSKKVSEIMYWNNRDADDYLEEIKNTIKL